MGVTAPVVRAVMNIVLVMVITAVTAAEAEMVAMEATPLLVVTVTGTGSDKCIGHFCKARNQR